METKPTRTQSSWITFHYWHHLIACLHVKVNKTSQTALIEYQGRQVRDKWLQRALTLQGHKQSYVTNNASAVVTFNTSSVNVDIFQ